MTVSTVVDTKNAEIATKNVQVALSVNCRVQHLDLDPRTSLLDALREHLRLTGTKKGWDHGQCGACTVLINGRRINSCLTLAVMLAPDLVERRAGVLERVEFVEDHFGLLQHRADGVEIRRMHVGAH